MRTPEWFVSWCDFSPHARRFWATLAGKAEANYRSRRPNALSLWRLLSTEVRIRAAIGSVPQIARPRTAREVNLFEGSNCGLEKSRKRLKIMLPKERNLR